MSIRNDGKLDRRYKPNAIKRILREGMELLLLPAPRSAKDHKRHERLKSLGWIITYKECRND